jgi:RNA polymerase sigma-70 factor (ECF subfamily)
VGDINCIASGKMARMAYSPFEAELNQVLGPAFGVAMRLCRNREDAEDLVREAALKALRAFDQYEPGTNFKAWFLKILYNLFAREYGKRKRMAPTVSLDDAPDLYLYLKSRDAGLLEGNQDPVAAILGRVDAERIAAAMDRLPEEFRETNAMYFFGDLSYQEIADATGSPIGSVRSRIHRGRKLLQKELWEIASEMGVAK